MPIESPRLVEKLNREVEKLSKVIVSPHVTIEERTHSLDLRPDEVITKIKRVNGVLIRTQRKIFKED